MVCITATNGLKYCWYDIVKNHSLYSTSNHTHRVIHACTATLNVYIKSCIIISLSFHFYGVFLPSFHHFVLFSPCHIFLKYLDSYVEICHVFMSLSFFHLPIFLIVLIILIIVSSFFSYFNTSFEFSLNLLYKLYDLHQNMYGKFRCYPQIMDQLHDIYVCDHLLKLSKCLFKF